MPDLDAEATYTGNKTDVGLGLRGDPGDDRLAVVGAESRIDTWLGLKRDVGDDRLAVMGAGNKMGAETAFRGDVGDDRLVVVDDGLAIGDDRSAVDNDKLAAGIGKRIDVDNESEIQTSNQSDAGLGNRLDADLIMTTTGDIRADLIKNFNNGVPIVVLVKLSRIVPDKHAMDFPTWILANVINNPLRDLFPLLMALSSYLFLSSLPTSTTDNSGNIPTTFIYYIFIYI